VRDLVSYNDKHNEANGENNRDGSPDNRSWNCGVEGDTDEPAINELRGRQMRNLAATVLLSQGCPMLLGGDEIGRTQRGNNNAYCQDNEISWLDWAHADSRMLAFVQRMIELRKTEPVLRRRRFFSGQEIYGSGRKDIAWFHPGGAEVRDEQWFDTGQRSLGMILNGDEIPDRDARGQRIRGDTLMVLLHAGGDAIEWSLPQGWGPDWSVMLDTAAPDEAAGARLYRSGQPVPTPAHSLLVLRLLSPSRRDTAARSLR
jgi:glycogen operon protein